MSNYDWQPSGRPYLKAATIDAGATHHIEFPRVTNELLILSRTAADLKLYFADPATTDAVAEGFEFQLTNNRDGFSLRVSVKEIWIVNAEVALAGGYTLAAELGELWPEKLDTLAGDGIGTEV